jgi:hypothetical protein
MAKEIAAYFKKDVRFAHGLGFKAGFEHGQKCKDWQDKSVVAAIRASLKRVEALLSRFSPA